MQYPDEPDYIWLDLDPTVDAKRKRSEDKGFNRAVEVALAAKEVLKGSKLISFIKTSGKTDMHIYIPCIGLNFKQARTITNHLADEIHALVKDISTRSESLNQRGDQV